MRKKEGEREREGENKIHIKIINISFRCNPKIFESKEREEKKEREKKENKVEKRKKKDKRQKHTFA